MPLSVEISCRHLRSENPSDRLEAARYLAAHAVPAHEGLLREALGERDCSLD
jgi:hypothetical protein